MKTQIVCFLGGVAAAILLVLVLPGRTPTATQPKVTAREPVAPPPGSVKPADISPADLTACLTPPAGTPPTQIERACTTLIAANDPGTPATVFIARAQAFIETNQDARAESDLASALERDAKNGAVYMLRGQISMKRRAFDDAQRNLDYTLKLNPNYNAALVLRGDLMLQRGATAEAVEDYTRAIAGGGASSRAYTSRAKAFETLADYGKAASDLNQVLQLEPQQNENFYQWRGSLLFNSGKFDDAIKDFNTAVAKNPRFAQALNDLGAVYIALNDNELAVEALNRAIDADARLTRAYENRAAAFARQMNYNSAIADLDRVLDQSPENAMALSNRCWSLAMKGDFDRARNDCDRALKLDNATVRAAAYDTLGLIALKENDFQLAIERYKQAISISAKPISLYGSAFARERLAESQPPTQRDLARKEAEFEKSSARRLDPGVEQEFLALLPHALSNSAAPEPTVQQDAPPARSQPIPLLPAKRPVIQQR